MKRVIIIIILVFVFVGGGAIASISGYISAIDQKNAILNGIIVETEISQISSNTIGDRNQRIYSVGYLYYDENEVSYLGYWKTGIPTIEEARSYLDKKIEIHIDGKGNSIPVGQQPTIVYSLIFAIIMPSIFLLLVIASIICFYKYRKWLKKMKPIWAAKQANTTKNQVSENDMEYIRNDKN